MIIEQTRTNDSAVRRNLNRIKAIRKICKDYKIDIAVSFMREPNFRLVLATWGIKTKAVISVRNDPNREYSGTVGKVVGKILLPCADGAVFQTEDAKGGFLKNFKRKQR